jgi:hypothetical protein
MGSGPSSYPMYLEQRLVTEGSAMCIVVDPSARDAFTPRELTAAYKLFEVIGPQYLDAETGIKASAYRFGERVLLIYEEAETGVVVLMHPSAQKVNSPKS